MQLRYRVVFILLILWSVMGAMIFFGSQQIILNSFTQLENQDAKQEITRLNNVTNTILNSFSQIVRDWSTWNDAYRFVDTKEQAFITNNLQPNNLSAIDVYGIIFFDAASNIVYSNIKMDNLKNLNKAPLKGFIKVQDQIAMIASQPILGSTGTGSPKGTLVMLRLLDNKLQKQISYISKIDTKITNIPTPKLSYQASSNRLTIYAPIRDIFGKVIGTYELNLPRNIYKTGILTTRYYALVLLGYSICFVILLWLLIRDLVIKRIEAIDKQFNKINSNRKANDRNIESLTEEVSYMTTLYHQATHDPLTGLANRNMLYQFFNHYVEQVKNTNMKIILLFIDLDYFKRINDTLGHDIGDKVLTVTANRLKSALRKNDLAIRLGGDEFVVMLVGVNTEVGKKIVDRLYKKINQPILIDKHDIYLSSSMGVAIYPDDGADIDTLVKNADITLYDVKEKGRSHYKFFSNELSLSIQATHQKEIQLQQAIDKDEFCLHYLPIYDSKNLKMIAIEALIRWNHPKKGLVGPAEIIPLAEKTGLIHAIGKWVLYTACKQARDWLDQGYSIVPIAVNLSTLQTKDTSIDQLVMHTLEQTKLDPKYLELELTETGFAEITPEILKELSNLKTRGIDLAIDDFGTGYSGLGFLKKLPVSKLKIDRIFISDILENLDDQAIALAIIGLAHQLGLRVTAEGVETQQQLDFLRWHGVDAVQGHYFSKPMDATACAKLLEGEKVEV